MTPGPRLVVVGGGIAGLAAAWEARHDAEVIVLEASERPGGKIGTRPFAGMPVELGPDVFLARVPWAVDLCHELGLTDELIAPDTGSAFVWSRGRLRPLPAGLALGVPTDLGALARSGIVSPFGLARAAADVVLPRRDLGDDPSAGEVVRSRFGDAVADRLVAPMLGGINAGDIDRLSLRSSAPQVAEVADRDRSLLAGLRRAASQRPPSSAPVFHSVAGGLQRLVTALTDALVAAGVQIRTGVAVDDLVTRPGGGQTLRLRPTGELDADVVVVATPAPVAAATVSEASPAAARLLDEIDHASVSMLTVAFRDDDLGPAADFEGSGYLVPKVEGRLTTAVTWYSRKWASAAPEGVTVLRISAGRYGDDRAMRLDDGDLRAALLDELAEMAGVHAMPLDTRVVRWAKSFPQYVPGHAARVERIEAALADDLPGVALAGAAYRGVGIPACIHQGRTAARRLLDTR